MLKSFFTFNKTNRQWHLPIVAGISVGIPLLLGWMMNNIESGKLGSLAGLSILYIQSNRLIERMTILMICCFGIMVSFTMGLLFSFNLYVAPFALAFLSFAAHYSLYKLNLTRPPGNFFFIMLASMAICTPFDLESIPEKVGYVAMGTIFTCVLGLIYSLLTLKETNETEIKFPQKKVYTNIVESLIFGLFMGLSLAVAFLLKLDNPYWIPISCLAVMQGSSTKHIGLRGTQRIIGTLIGLGITWLIAFGNPTTLFIVISIIFLQIIVEFLVVRNYTLAVVFITILTIFLAESGGNLSAYTNQIFTARLVDIIIGSIIGIAGGWILFHEKLHFQTTLRLKKSKVIMKNLCRDKNPKL
jgi:hypothetical protein